MYILATERGETRVLASTRPTSSSAVQTRLSAPPSVISGNSQRRNTTHYAEPSETKRSTQTLFHGLETPSHPALPRISLNGIFQKEVRSNE